MCECDVERDRGVQRCCLTRSDIGEREKETSVFAVLYFDIVQRGLFYLLLEFRIGLENVDNFLQITPVFEIVQLDGERHE